MRFLSLALLTAAVWSADPADLPVRQVTLYASGVGYLEHVGSVTGDAAVELRFQGGQLNDALKSLVAQDAGGRLGTIIYPSQDPLEKTLASFQVNLAGAPTFAGLLGQLRGAAVTVRWQSETLTGTILGIESRTRTVGERTVVTQPVLTLLASGTVRQVPLEEAQAVTLDDPGLQQELARALGVISQSRDQEKRPLVLHFTGVGAREVRVGYVIEMPLWKTSYRLVLPGAAGGRASLQGWALVDNQTDTDWTGITLALVSGRPLGFVQDLASPRYRSRPVVAVEDAEMERPVAYGAGRPAIPAAMAESKRKGRAMAAGVMAAEFAADAAMDITASVESRAQGDDLGMLFRFTVQDVTLPRQRSAMLPIVTDTVEAESVSIYRPLEGGRHPRAGAWLTNSTGTLLLGGPMTVLAGGAYAGDALIESLPPGGRRLLAYAVDLPLTVDGGTTTEERVVTRGAIRKGVLWLTTRLEIRRTYQAANEDDAARRLIIEHPARPGWTLADDPLERSGDLARYALAVPARGQANLVVRESLVSEETVVIGDMDSERVQAVVTGGGLSKPVREAMIQAAGLMAQVHDAERQERQAQADIAAITAEQGRLRENMKTIQQTSALYQRLLTKLNDQETRIEALQAQVVTHRTAAQEARTRLQDFLTSLDRE